MPSLGPAEALRHRAFEAAPASRLDGVRLNDRGRLAVLLQGSAILAHLARAGWHLPTGWDGAAVAADGTLALPAPAPGRPRHLPQELLRALVARLFGSDEVRGRGEARRAIRALHEAWRQSLVPLPPDEVVAAILEEAPLLWQESFAPARRALAAEVLRHGEWRLWLAGPRQARRRLLAAAADRASLERLLAAAEARELWRGGGGEPSPGRLAGRPWAVLEVWRERPPKTPAERLEMARALYHVGRFARALSALSGLRTTAARLLRAQCQVRLGRLVAARRTLRHLATGQLTPPEVMEVAELGVRVAANQGAEAEIDDWVARAAAAGEGALAPRAALIAALAAWDRGDLATMERHLEAIAGCRDDPRLAWRWHRAKGLAASLAGEPRAAVEHLGRAVAAGRRRLARFDAGALWNDLGVCRGQNGDLAGAERAFLHTMRLLGACEGPRATTLALYNLAEIRLRRGRLKGVRAIIEQATLANRLSGNFRGGIQDSELWIRLELAQGRARAALALCREALGDLDRRKSSWRRPVLETLAARALGWLGRPAEAAAALARAGTPALEQLEAEEVPALWALAGDREAALAAAAVEAPWAVLWRGLLVDGEAGERAWTALEGLEDFRAARLVFDAEQVSAGAVPVAWLRRAAAVLRRHGAAALAEPLETRDLGAWHALGEYLAKPPETAALLTLLTRLGGREVSLAWVTDGDRTTLLDGVGGEEEVAADLGAGRLVLAAPRLDGPLRALFALAVRDLDPAALAGEGAAARRRRPARGGILGESQALTVALARLERLAPSDLPLLILGESGTGKELAARHAHRLSRRAERPFVALNCAAVAENLLLSDLFGHVRGSFTGADRDRAGVFEAARGGTVLLDEIGDLPPAAQGMLLRALQEGEVRRVGESLPRKVDVRVIAATHRDLAAAVRDGRFREDLYFRLKVAAVGLPPLRERGEDVLRLAESFLVRAARGGPSPRLSAAARRVLAAHPWPGNVRELHNVVRVAVALATAAGDPRRVMIRPEHLDLPAAGSAGAGPVPAPERSYQDQVEALRRRLLSEALAATGGNRAAAARRLGLSRQSLSYLVRRLGLL